MAVERGPAEKSTPLKTGSHAILATLQRDDHSGEVRGCATSPGSPSPERQRGRGPPGGSGRGPGPDGPGPTLHRLGRRGQARKRRVPHRCGRKSGSIPKAKELRGSWCRDGYEIKLVNIPAWRLPVLEPVPVPSRLTHPHTVVRAMQNQSQPLGLTRLVQGRTLRLIQALITAAETQGHACSAGATGAAPWPHRRRSAPCHFSITAQGQAVGFPILQEQDRKEHVAT